MMSDPSSPWDVLAVYRWKACRGSRRSPPKGAKRKRKEDTKRRQEATAHAGAQRPPPTGRLRGRVRESTPRPAWIHKQNSPQLDLGRSNANARSCWTIANAKPQLRRGWGRQRLRHPEPKQSRCQLTACFTCQPGVGRTSWALHLQRSLKRSGRRRRTENPDSPTP